MLEISEWFKYIDWVMVSSYSFYEQYQANAMYVYMLYQYFLMMGVLLCYRTLLSCKINTLFFNIRPAQQDWQRKP